MNKSKKILIIGAGDLGRQMAHFISNYSDDVIIGWLDDTKKNGELILEKPILGKLEQIDEFFHKFDEVVIGIGYKHLKFKWDLVQELKRKNINLYTFIHPTAYVDCSSIIKEGCFIYPQATIDQYVVLDEAVIVNNAAIISHDCIVDSCTFIAPGVNVSGKVKIGSRCFIGTGSTIIDSIEITDEVTLGARTLVCENVVKPGKYVGGPILRRLK